MRLGTEQLGNEQLQFLMPHRTLPVALYQPTLPGGFSQGPRLLSVAIDFDGCPHAGRSPDGNSPCSRIWT